MMYRESFTDEGVLQHYTVPLAAHIEEEALRFFDTMDYEDTQAWLQGLLVAAMESEAASHWDHRQCADHLRYHEQLCGLLRTVHLLCGAQEGRAVAWVL